MSKLRKIRAGIIESKDRFIGIFKILKRLNALETNLNKIQDARHRSLESKIDSLHKKLEINLKLQEIKQEFMDNGVNEKLDKILNIDKKTKEINKNTFLLLDYSGCFTRCDWYNLGDDMQTIATRMALEHIFPNQNLSFEYFDRDSLSYYKSKDNARIPCIIQAYLSLSYDFLPSKDILPIFLGTHFCESSKEFLLDVLVHYPHYFDNYEIGCRDKSTLEFCQNYGIKSYFSRCLTLTLPKRQNLDSQNKVFIVNVPNEFLEYIPPEIMQNAEIIKQALVYYDKYTNWKICHNDMKTLLNRYKNEAKLIITDRLHVASPCTALGIPVIWIKHTKEQNTRFSALDGVLKTYSFDDFKNGVVDFNPKAPNIEALKSYMLENLKLSILQSFGEKIDTNHLQNIREKIANFNCL